MWALTFVLYLTVSHYIQHRVICDGATTTVRSKVSVFIVSYVPHLSLGKSKWHWLVLGWCLRSGGRRHLCPKLYSFKSTLLKLDAKWTQSFVEWSLRCNDCSSGEMDEWALYIWREYSLWTLISIIRISQWQSYRYWFQKFCVNIAVCTLLCFVACSMD